jgi:hypothetical protein
MSKERQAELFAPDPELPAAQSPSAAASAPVVAGIVFRVMDPRVRLHYGVNIKDPFGQASAISDTAVDQLG